MKISIIIPCYNEEESIGDVIQNIKKSIPLNLLQEIIVVDNNSTDESAEIAQKNGAKVISEKKQGYGAALKTGFKKSRGEIIATLDADGQYPAELIPEITNYLLKNNLDFISCNRVPFSSGSQSFTRKVGNWLLTKATNLIFNINLKDSQSGMWVFKKSVFEKIWPESDDMPLSEEFKILAILHPQIKFEEYYIPYRPRIGESKLFPLKHGLKNLLYLFKLKKKLTKEKAYCWLKNKPVFEPKQKD